MPENPPTSLAPNPGPDLHPVCATARRRELDDWLVVLAAAGIPAQTRRVGSVWQIFVPAPKAMAARAHVREFQVENPGHRRKAPLVIDLGPSPIGVVSAAVLLGMHGASFLGPGREYWIQHGRASAWFILDGELWRTVTALTLHADAAHVAGNAAGLFVFAGAVCRMLGGGVGLLAVLGSGFLGNLMNALYRGGPHASIGASTAVFGAVGILAGMQLIRRFDWGGDRRRFWLPLGAAVAILAMVGVSAESDFLAHLFGMLAGLGLGAGLTALRRDPWSVAVQRVSFVAVPLIVAASWAAALTGR